MKRPHSALGYRPPASETIVPMDHSSGAGQFFIPEHWEMLGCGQRVVSSDRTPRLCSSPETIRLAGMGGMIGNL